MYFLNPSAFWAFSLLLVPIVIHLFNFRRLKKVYFTNLSFLQNVNQQQQSRSTLKKLLVLATRLLVFVFIVLAFSRPVMSDEMELPEQGPIAIYIDNSYSMQQGDLSGEPLLYSAFSIAGRFAEQRAQTNEVMIFTNDGHHRPTKGMSMPEVLFSPSWVLLEDVMDKIDLYPVSRVHIFSDLQRSTTLPIGDILADTGRNVTFHKIIGRDQKNLYVDTLYLEKPVGLTGGNTVHFSVKNTHGEATENVLLKVEKDGRQLASFTTDIAANSVKALSLEIGLNEPMEGSYKLSIQDNPIVFDNDFYFAIGAANKPLVVVLSESKSGAGNYFEKVFSNKQYFQLIVNDIENASFQDITNSDLLVLNGLSEIPDWLTSQRDEIKGRILLVPGADTNEESYSSFMGLRITPRQLQTGQLSQASLENPLFEGVFNERNDRVSLPEVRVAYGVSGHHEAVISTNQGLAYLVKSGVGNTYFLTSPLADSITNFHKHALFVPVMYRMAQPLNNPPLSYRLGERLIRLSSAGIESGEIIELKNATDVFIPSYRYLNNEILIEIPDVLESPGFYHLTTKEDTLGVLALNYDKRESETQPMDTEAFRALIAGYDHVSLDEVTAVETVSNDGASAGDKHGIWKYALILALFFLVTESILLRFI